MPRYIKSTIPGYLRSYEGIQPGGYPRTRYIESAVPGYVRPYAGRYPDGYPSISRASYLIMFRHTRVDTRVDTEVHQEHHTRLSSVLCGYTSRWIPRYIESTVPGSVRSRAARYSGEYLRFIESICCTKHNPPYLQARPWFTASTFSRKNTTNATDCPRVCARVHREPIPGYV